MIERDELLSAIGVGKSALRKYIQLGLIEHPHMEYNGPGKTRVLYSEAALETLREVKRLQQKGYTLKTIRFLLSKDKIDALFLLEYKKICLKYKRFLMPEKTGTYLRIGEAMKGAECETEIIARQSGIEEEWRKINTSEDED